MTAMTEQEAIRVLREALEALRSEYKTVMNSAYCQCDEDEELLSRVGQALAATIIQPAAEPQGEQIGARAAPVSSSAIELVGEVRNKPANEFGTLSWPRVIWNAGLFALPPVGTKLYTVAAQATPTDEAKDAARYRWLREKSVGQWEHPIVVEQLRALDRMQYIGPLTFEALDKAIDAAIEAKEGKA